MKSSYETCFAADDFQMHRMRSNSTHRDSYNHMGGGEIAAVKHGMSLPFQPLSISFEDVKYFVDMPVVSPTAAQEYKRIH